MEKEKVTYLSESPVFNFLDGKEYVLDGVDGYFKALWQPLYPDLMEHRLYHIPSKKGKEGESYIGKKEEYGDDWDTDLTGAIEEYCNIAIELGYVETENGRE